MSHELLTGVTSCLKTQSQPDRQRGGECDTGKEVGGEFVVAGGEATDFLAAAEGVLNEVPPFKAFAVVTDRALAVTQPPRERPIACA